jgi:hypothetical protein
MFTRAVAPEKERAADAVDHHIGRHDLATISRPPVFFVGDVVAHESGAALHVDRFRHPVHEQERAEQHADADAGEKIDKYRQQESREQHDRVGDGGAQQESELGLVGHAPGDHHEHAGQRGQRHIATSGIATRTKTSK